MSTPATASPIAASAPTDISASRRYLRFEERRWRAARRYPTYGVYGPRPHEYRPYQVFVPLPFGFNVGYNPNPW
jgi:hypothetical protein